MLNLFVGKGMHDPVSETEALSALKRVGNDIDRLQSKRDHLTLPQLFSAKFSKPPSSAARMWKLWQLYFSKVYTEPAADCRTAWAGGWKSTTYYGMHVVCNRSYSAECIALTYGVEQDYTFELDFASQTGCEVYALDPSVNHR